jgi:hypothetical protein
LNSHVRDCVRSYTSPWLIVQRKCQEYSSGSLARHSASRFNTLSSTPRQEFEIDGEFDLNGEEKTIDPPTNKVFSFFLFKIILYKKQHRCFNFYNLY